jgi:hypothetical protein
VLEDHTRPVLSLAIADGKLFSGSYDYTIKAGGAAHARLHLPPRPAAPFTLARVLQPAVAGALP